MAGTTISMFGFLLALCYGEIRETRYDIHHNKRLDVRHVFMQTSARSRGQCAVFCSTILTCWTANYHEKSKTCKMSTRSPRTESLGVVDDTEWDILHRTDVCYEGWVNTTDTCYLFAEVKLNWTDAQDFCQSYNSSLVEIQDNDESNTLTTLLQNISLQRRSTDSFYWIGLFGRGHDFVWKTSNSIVNYTDWHNPPSAQPTDIFDNACVEMVQRFSFNWDYVKCDEELYFVCERHIN